MKKSYLYVFAVMLLALTSCNDLLDKEPRDQFINNPSFWSNQYQVENYCNMFYNTAFSGYGQGGSGGDFYFSSLGDDQVNPNFDNWTFTSVPQTASAWNSNFTEIRRANYLIKGMETSTLSTADKEKYTAIGRLNRALHYYRLVRAYGDPGADYELIHIVGVPARFDKRIHILTGDAIRNNSGAFVF